MSFEKNLCVKHYDLISSIRERKSIPTLEGDPNTGRMVGTRPGLGACLVGGCSVGPATSLADSSSASSFSIVLGGRLDTVGMPLVLNGRPDTAGIPLVLDGRLDTVGIPLVLAGRLDTEAMPLALGGRLDTAGIPPVLDGLLDTAGMPLVLEGRLDTVGTAPVLGGRLDTAALRTTGEIAGGDMAVPVGVSK